MSPSIAWSFLFMSLSLTLASSSSGNLVRRLNEEESDPTQDPTRSPTVSPSCVVSYAGASSPDIVNPSSVSMGLINIASSDSDIEFIDLETGDTVLDADQADLWCAAKFGTKAVTPQNADQYNAMVNLCESMGGGNACYMGLFREDYANGVTCDLWRGEDSTFTITSNDVDTLYGNGWANNQPTCPFDTTHPNYNSGTLKHCVQYKTNPNNLRVVSCQTRMHIICEFNGQCNV